MIPAALLLVTSFFFFLKLFIFIASSLKNSQNFFMQPLPLYTSYFLYILHILWLFSMLLKENIVDIEKPDGICLHTFVVDEFSGLFLHPLFFSDMHSISP